MTNSPILDGNERDAGVVEEICGYLTDIRKRPARTVWTAWIILQVKLPAMVVVH